MATVRKASNAGESLILDSSAILAIILQQPGYERALDRIGNAGSIGVGTPTVVETAIVLSAKMGRDARSRINDFLREAEADLIPFTTEHFDVAVDAFLRFGKGRHAAALNFGDCLTYAVAVMAGVPLLYIGGDFLKTDLGKAAFEDRA